jgi:hypothetical protein
MRFIKKGIALLLLAIPACVLAQPGLGTEQVEVIKDFEARLLNTEKISVRPELPSLDTLASIKAPTYDVIARMLNVQYLPPEIRPSSYREEIGENVNSGYARLGGGFPKAFYGDAGYHMVNEQVELGANLLFNSADNSNQVENQKYFTGQFKADGTYFFEPGYAISGRLGYQADNLFYYGYNQLAEEENRTISFEGTDVQQRFRTFNMGASIFNGERTEADFNYRGDLDVYFLRDNYATKENGYKLRLEGAKWFEEAHSLNVELITDFTNYRDTAKQTLNNIFLHPTFNYHGDNFQVKVGVNLASHEDEFSFFPDVEVSVNVLENVLTAFAGIEGTLYKNNFQNLSNYNPFILPRLELRNTSYNHFFGGIKGEYQGIDYHAQIGYKNTNDLALYLSNADTVPQFNVVYDTVSIFTISGSLSLPLLENLEIIGSFAQHVYSTSSQDKAWHLPSLELNVEARYKMMEDRLTLKGNLFAENGVPFLRMDGTSENLNALLDINAGAEFQFTDNIGGFIQVNNLLDNNRQRWRYYPIMGINGVVGLTAKF